MTETKPQTGSVGIVETQYLNLPAPNDYMVLESGQTLGPIRIAYETYGTLNEAKNNAILIEHSFSGDAHAAGYHAGDAKPGWWDTMIGPGKSFDTDKYFIICSNVIGGCRGSIGPSSINPQTGKPYALNFPIITLGDMARAQGYFLDALGIDKLVCVSGGSMGGMMSLQFFSVFPERTASCIPIACTLKHSPQQIAFDEVGRQAVMSDAAWRDGDYYDHGQPERGLALARMIGHITYMSDQSMEEKFSRKLREKNYTFSLENDFEVEGYLHNRGDNFVKRFDANSYLYITKAMDYYDLSQDKLVPKDKSVNTHFLVIAFKSDWLYPAYQSKEIVQQLRLNQIDATYCEIDSTYGHDAFLLEIEQQSDLISHFLNRVYNEITNQNGH